MRAPRAAWAVSLALGLIGPRAWSAPANNEPALALADLAGYRAALDDRHPETPSARVGFRTLWDHPERYQGRKVEVEGRVVRRFRQGAVGTFPPLVEAWAVTGSGDPFCWVYPESAGAPTPGPEPVRFTGTFLRRIRYQGADAPRLAPLIVGPAPPVALRPSAPPAQGKAPGLTTLDWTLGLLAACFVLVVLVWQHARRPVAFTPPGPPPEFHPPAGAEPPPDAAQSV